MLFWKLCAGSWARINSSFGSILAELRQQGGGSNREEGKGVRSRGRIFAPCCPNKSVVAGRAFTRPRRERPERGQDRVFTLYPEKPGAQIKYHVPPPPLRIAGEPIRLLRGRWRGLGGVRTYIHHDGVGDTAIAYSAQNYHRGSP